MKKIPAKAIAALFGALTDAASAALDGRWKEAAKVLIPAFLTFGLAAGIAWEYFTSEPVEPPEVEQPVSGTEEEASQPEEDQDPQ